MTLILGACTARCTRRYISSIQAQDVSERTTANWQFSEAMTLLFVIIFMQGNIAFGSRSAVIQYTKEPTTNFLKSHFICELWSRWCKTCQTVTVVRKLWTVCCILDPLQNKNTIYSVLVIIFKTNLTNESSTLNLVSSSKLEGVYKPSLLKVDSKFLSTEVLKCIRDHSTMEEMITWYHRETW